MEHTGQIKGQFLRRWVSIRRRRYLSAYWMIAPALVLYIIFVIYPIMQGVWLSLHLWDGFSDMKWVGLQNYRFVLADQVFWLAVRHTLLFAMVVTLVKNVLGMFLAILLNLSIRGQTFFRVSAFLPVTMAFVVIGVLWSWIYNPTFGLLNDILRAAGLGFLIRGWLSDTRLALWSIMLVDIWKWTGFHTVLFLAGLQSIPSILYDAAIIDGAGRWQRFTQITLPLLKQVTAVSITLSFVGALVSNYDLVYVMTGGGPYHSTEVASTWIISTAFRFAALGKASAMSFILFGLAFTIGVFQLAVMTRRRNEM